MKIPITIYEEIKQDDIFRLTDEHEYEMSTREITKLAHSYTEPQDEPEYKWVEGIPYRVITVGGKDE